jgi:hypothetical protein
MERAEARRLQPHYTDGTMLHVHYAPYLDYRPLAKGEPQAVIWCAAGIALSLCSLAGISAMLTWHGFIRKLLAATVYMFGVTFTGISGLGICRAGERLVLLLRQRGRLR